MERALDNATPVPLGAPTAPAGDPTSKQGSPIARYEGRPAPACEDNADDADDEDDIDLESLLRRNLVAAEQAALAGRRDHAAALLAPLVELARALSESPAFVHQRQQLLELGGRAEELLGASATPPEPATPPESHVPSDSELTGRVPPPPQNARPSSPKPTAAATELASLLQNTAEEIDRIELARRRIAAL